MDKIKMLQKIKDVYEKNGNIISYLKEYNDKTENKLEDILISYDFQAGAYTQGYKESPEKKDLYCLNLAKVIQQLGSYENILEVGVGEATTLAVLLSKLNTKPKEILGFDMSWSRIKYAKKFIEETRLENVDLFTADLFNMPLKDNSIDIVYTSHSIEPNGGKEKEALEELYRVANRYLILLEPTYELANDEARKRMKEHGYITNLLQTAKDLNYNIIEHRLFDISANPLNPTGLLIIKKDSKENKGNSICCPITKTDIIKNNDSYYSPESMLAYPVIDGIPCLLEQNAIVATKYLN